MRNRKWHQSHLFIIFEREFNAVSFNFLPVAIFDRFESSKL